MSKLKTVAREYVPLNEEDLHALSCVKSPGTDEAAALQELTGVSLGSRPSKAAAIHALVEAGRKAVEEKALEIAYRREAEFTAAHKDCQQWTSAMSGRALLPFLENQGTSAA